MSIFDKFKTKKKEERVRKEPVFQRRKRSNFEAAENNNFLGGWSTTDYETINSKLWTSLDVLRARSRQAERDNPIANRFLNVAVRNVVGDGFVCRPKSGNKELDMAIQRALKRQSRRENFSTQGVITRTQFEQLVIHSILRDGEFLAIKKRTRRGTGFALQLLDPAQLFTQFTGSVQGGRVVQSSQQGRNLDNGNRIILGVEVDKDYRPVAYHFYTSDTKKYASNIFTYTGGEILRVPAENVIHLFVPQYVNQVRGIPHLHAALKDLETQRRYNDTAFQAARKGASMAVIVKTKDGAEFSGDGKQQQTDTDFGLDYTGENVTQLSDTETLETHDFAYPHQQYAPFTDKTNERIAAGMDSSSPTLTNNFAGINFSAGQLMYYDDRDNWKRWQSFIADNFHAWWYPDWIKIAMLRGDVKSSTGEPFGVELYEAVSEPEWLGKQFPPVDQAKAANANATNIQSGVKSRAQVIREMGEDPQEVFQEIEAEREMFTPATPTETEENAPSEQESPSNDDSDEGEE